jgi:serpin B
MPTFLLRCLADKARIAPLALLTALTGCTNSDDSPASAHREDRAISSLTPELAPVLAANDQLSWSLYRQLAVPERNLFFSPFSLSAALAMTSLGARGDTEKELHAALGIPSDSNAYHQAFGALLADLSGPHPGRGYQLHLANRLFGQQGSLFAAPFLDALSQHYDAPLAAVDYRSDAEAARTLVNAWVADATQNEIAELVPLGVFDQNTRLTLANAIYFQASWATAFDPTQSADAPFLLESGLEKSLPFMHLSARFRVAGDELFSSLSLDYADQELCMTILLPRERGQLATAAAALDAARFRALASARQEITLELSLPRFEIHAEAAVVPALKALGVRAAFDSLRADFSAMLEQSDAERELLYLTSVLHRGYVRVDETGTTAAAASAAVVGTRATRPEFRVDQPFIFTIEDKLTGALLFVGKVADPS